MYCNVRMVLCVAVVHMSVCITYLYVRHTYKVYAYNLGNS